MKEFIRISNNFIKNPDETLKEDGLSLYNVQQLVLTMSNFFIYHS